MAAASPRAARSGYFTRQIYNFALTMSDLMKNMIHLCLFINVLENYFFVYNQT